MDAPADDRVAELLAREIRRARVDPISVSIATPPTAKAAKVSVNAASDGPWAANNE